MGKFEVHDGSNRPDSAADRSLHGSLSRQDWQQFCDNQKNNRGGSSSSSSSNDGFLTFDNSCYGNHGNNPLSKDAGALRQDVEGLKGLGKGSQAYDKALAKLNTDEMQLRKDVFSFKDGSTDYQSFAKTMESYHKELKSIANDLWGMGLKQQASDTTAYYPLSHYKHEFDERGKHPGHQPPGEGTPPPPEGNPPPPIGNPGQPGNPGDNPPPGIPGGTLNNLDGVQGWTKNLNDGEIGGSGNVQGIDLTPGPGGTLDYHSRMGAYGDTLISKPVQFNAGDNTFQMNMDFNRSSATAGNTQCLEQDMVITNGSGMQAVAGSQFDLSQKAPPGMCWFQTWDTKTSHWMNAALVPVPTPDQMHNMSMTVKLNGDNTYTYTNLNLDGKTYALQNNTFEMKQSNWKRNEVIFQLQEDANGKGGPVDVQYKNLQVQTGYRP